jgi:hypothetical protein
MARKTALSADIKNGMLTIKVGVDILKFAAEHSEKYWLPNTDKYAFVIDDADAFASDLLSTMQDEEEDGTSNIHKFIDAMIELSVDQGNTGIDIDAMEQLQAAEDAFDEDEG